MSSSATASWFWRGKAVSSGSQVPNATSQSQSGTSHKQHSSKSDLKEMAKPTAITEKKGVGLFGENSCSAAGEKKKDYF